MPDDRVAVLFLCSIFSLSFRLMINLFYKRYKKKFENSQNIKFKLMSNLYLKVMSSIEFSWQNINNKYVFALSIYLYLYLYLYIIVSARGYYFEKKGEPTVSGNLLWRREDKYSPFPKYGNLATTFF